MSADEARAYAYERELDVVEVAAGSDPPVCRVLDYGKWRYAEERKLRESQKRQAETQVRLKEVRFAANLAPSDYAYRSEQALAFLRKGSKVKVVVRFKGRQARASGTRAGADRAARVRRAGGRQARACTARRGAADDGGARPDREQVVKHVYALAELYLRHGDMEAARDAYLASLDADEGLAVLLVPASAVQSAAASRRGASRCDRCGARLSRKRRHRCSRCGLAIT